jgi:thiamine biosynthesis lipoprotein
VVSPTVGPAPARALKAARAAVDEILMAVDAACSRFRPDSEVHALAAAHGQALRASPTLLAVLEVALRAADVTGGAVDPTLGNAMVAVGYDRTLADLPDDRPAGPPVRLTRSVRWADIDLDLVAGTVRVPDGVLLDLGALAKAYAADTAAASARQRTGAGVLVSLGGDVSVAGTDPDEPWTVQVLERPDDAGGPLVDVFDGGVATSTTRARRWLVEGRPFHHLLDPTTGLPVPEVWRTVTVAAADCVDANTASTATVVKGAGGLAWLEATGLPARLVAADGTVRSLGGWPAEGPDGTP